MSRLRTILVTLVLGCMPQALMGPAVARADANCPICTEIQSCGWEPLYGWTVCEVVNGVCSGSGDCTIALDPGDGGEPGEKRHGATGAAGASAKMIFVDVFRLSPQPPSVAHELTAHRLAGLPESAGSRSLRRALAATLGHAENELGLVASVTVAGTLTTPRDYSVPGSAAYFTLLPGDLSGSLPPLAQGSRLDGIGRPGRGPLVVTNGSASTPS